MSDTKNPSNFDIDFNPDLFNPIYWHLLDAFNDTSLRYIWAFGGSSAAKTYSIVQLCITDMMQGENNNYLILRKYAVDIKDSIYQDFKNIIREWGLDEFFIIQQNYIYCQTGSYIRFRGLDDSEKVKGITGYKRVILEEISQFVEKDFKQIRKRLRGRAGQQIIGLFNPISEDHWIKRNVFDKEILTPVDMVAEAKTKGYADEDWVITGKWLNKLLNTVILKVTYLDNKYIVGPHFIDKHVIEDFEKDKIDDNIYYMVYGLGNWGKIRTGGEFWKDFDANLHVKENQIQGGKLEMYDPELPIHITWDNNVNPYVTCLLWQTKNIDGKKLTWQFDEICLEDPRNKVKHTCAEFIKRYPVGMVQGVFIYGDRTSIKEDTTKEKGENFFTEILTLLKDYPTRLRVGTSNPSVVQSGNFVNEIYAKNQGNISITIGRNCRASIHDYQYALEDSEGGIDKRTRAHEVTGVRFEEFGHCSDAKRYLFTMLFANEYAEYKKGGKRNTVRLGARYSKNQI